MIHRIFSWCALASNMYMTHLLDIKRLITLYIYIYIYIYMYFCMLPRSRYRLMSYIATLGIYTANDKTFERENLTQKLQFY